MPDKGQAITLYARLDSKVTALRKLASRKMFDRWTSGKGMPLTTGNRWQPSDPNARSRSADQAS